jgi:hypothetical protein
MGVIAADMCIKNVIDLSYLFLLLCSVTYEALQITARCWVSTTRALIQGTNLLTKLTHCIGTLTCRRYGQIKEERLHYITIED